MKIAAICCTYKRPGQLATALESFVRQDYPAELCEMIVLDDADQYPNQEGDRWRLVSIPVRFRTLGEKRNASAALVSPEVEAYCVWDDDDVYLPWHMRAAAACLANADYTIPTLLYTDQETHLRRKSNQCFYHGAWAFRRAALDQVGGYPFIQNGEDQGLLRRFKSAGLRRADPIQCDPRPSYVYRWHTTHSQHLSAMGATGYQQLGRVPAERVGRIVPRWDRDWTQVPTSEDSPPAIRRNRANTRG